MNKKILESVRKAIAFDLIYDFDDIKERYDEQDTFYEGHRVEKEFFRVDSKYFQPLIDELLNNPDCGYYTYANDVIKEGVVPEKLSCLLKQLKKSHYSDNSPHKKLSVNEVLSSQILNYYGCPTTYNVPIVVNDCENNNEYKILSVDFATEGKDFKTFDEFNANIWNNTKDSLERIVLALDDMGFTEDVKNKFMEDFVASHIVRTHILTDFDFSSKNAGMLGDKYLNFDYELCFKEYDNVERAIKRSTLQSNLIFAKNNYPTIYVKLKQKTYDLSKAVNYLIDNDDFVFANGMHEYAIKYILRNNLQDAVKIFDKIEKEIYPGM